MRTETNYDEMHLIITSKAQLMGGHEIKIDKRLRSIFHISYFKVNFSHNLTSNQSFCIFYLRRYIQLTGHI